MSRSGAVFCGLCSTIPVAMVSISVLVSTLRDRSASAAMKGVTRGNLGALTPGPTVVAGRLTASAPVDAPMSGPALAYTFVLKENQVRVTGKARLTEIVDDKKQGELQLTSAEGTCAVQGDVSELLEDGASGESNLLAGRPPPELLAAMARYGVSDSTLLGMERARKWHERLVREQDVAIFGDVNAVNGGLTLAIRRIAKGTAEDLEAKLTDGGNLGGAFGAILLFSLLIPIAAVCGGFFVK